MTPQSQAEANTDVNTQISVALTTFKNTCDINANAKIPGDFLRYTQLACNYFEDYNASQIYGARIKREKANKILEEINENIRFVENAIALQEAVTTAANDPQWYVNTHNDKEMKELVKQFIPTMKQAANSGYEAAAYDYSSNVKQSERLKTIKYLADTFSHATSFVTDKSKNHKGMAQLLNDGKLVTQNVLAKELLHNPKMTQFLGSVLLGLGIALAIKGALACWVPGGFIVGIPLIAAGVALTVLANKVLNVVGANLFKPTHVDYRGQPSLRYKKLALSNVGENLKELVAAKSIFNSADKAIASLNKTNLFRKRANSEPDIRAPSEKTHLLKVR